MPTLRPSTLLRASCLTTSATSAPRHDSGEIDQGIIDTLAAVNRLVEVGPAPGPVWAVSERWREEASGGTADGDTPSACRAALIQRHRLRRSAAGHGGDLEQAGTLGGQI